MIIQSLRLKNVKSYGEGLEGNGITVNFRPGINRVAGRNGYGKSTLIEALGYALFLCEPQVGERFALNTYFLRAGKKEGEIDVTFEREGLSYRVERGLGQSKRRSKVVQLNDGSTCAEGDEAVSAWLCRLLTTDQHRLANPTQIADLFSNLVGIKQGRLNRPFDCKPREAKDFFDPLLDVAVFGQCHSNLSDATQHFKQLQQEQNLKLATIEERIRERAGSLEKVPVKEAQAETLMRLVEKGRRQKEEATQLKTACEKKLHAAQQAEKALDAARNQWRLTAQKRENEQHLWQESHEAAAQIQRHETAFRRYVQAEARLRELQLQQKQRSTLQQARTEALNAKTEWAAREEFALKQAADLKGQVETRARQIQSIQRELERNRQRLQTSRAEFERSCTQTAAAQRSWEALERWLANSAAQIQREERALAVILKEWTKIGRWNADEISKARSDEARLLKAVQDVSRRLAKAEQARTTLAAQLTQISGGVCPFLKEKCRQFDPKAIQSDLDQSQQEIDRLTAEHRSASKLHQSAGAALAKMAAQEIELSHLQQTLSERVRNWIEQHNQFCPAALQQEAAELKRYLGAKFKGFPRWTAIAPEDRRNDFRSWSEPSPLTQLFQAQQEFATQARAVMETADPSYRQQIDLCQQERQQRAHQERDLENAAKQLQQTEAEFKSLAARQAATAADQEKAAQHVNAAGKRLEELDGQLKNFHQIDQEFATQNELKDQHAEAHRLYLGASAAAAKLEERAKQLQAARQQELDAQKALEEREVQHRAATAGFDPAALESARDQAAAAAAKLALDERNWQNAERELQEEKARLKQWKEACATRITIQDAVGRLEAAGQLSRLAAQVLRDTAPAVAQHLCGRISAAAQRIFNQINPEPIELEWKAEPQYSLRISPGDRRFGMLSGGEQTKLALAMTLAMIEQFSGLRFAVFDEPTYGVDAESRERLSDAIIASEKAARLDQLILVSHDNAFDGKIEHVVLLHKSAGTGTELVATA